MLKLGFWILCGLTVLRYWVCFQAPIVPSEAYLYMCTRRLDFAFFDGPAGPATLVYWGSKLFTNSLLAFRWSAPLFSLVATVVAYFLGKKLYGVSAGFASALLINVLPGFQIGSIQPESTLPALTFWILGMLCIWNALKTSNWWWWIAGGTVLALGLQFSYWILLALVSCILCVLGKRSYFSVATLIGCGILFFLCLAALTGPIEWNIRQHWIPFSGWTWEALVVLEHWKHILVSLLRQTSLPGAFLVVLALILCFQNIRLSIKARFLTAFVVPPLVATLFLIIRSEQGPILFAVVPLFVWLGGNWQSTSPKLAWGNAVICALTAFCSLLTLVTWPSFANKGLQKAAITVEQIARIQNAIFSSELGKIFFIAETPAIVAEFEYAFAQMGSASKTSNRYEIFLRESPDLSNQLRLWPSYCDFSDSTHPSDPLFTEQKGINRYLGRSALYITPEEGLLPQTISAAFQRIIPLHTLRIRRNGQVSRQLNVYLCRNYQSLPL